LDTYIEGKYNDWLVSMQNDEEHKEDEEDKGKDGSSSLVAGLESHLMVRQQRTEEEMFHAASEGLQSQQHKETMKRNKHSGRLENNFDHNLMRLFSEVRLWDTFEGMPIPYVAHDLANNQNERLRQLRDHVMIVVRGYNDVIDALDTREKRLFSDHVRQMDRRIAQGLNKLNWNHKTVKTWFVPACKTVCDDTLKVVEEYKQGMELIHTTCRAIKRTQLILIEKNTVYEEGEFEAKQQEHRTTVTQTLQAAHNTINSTLQALRPAFLGSKSSDVQREWVHLVRSVDQRVEAAVSDHRVVSSVLACGVAVPVHGLEWNWFNLFLGGPLCLPFSNSCFILVSMIVFF
jgi:dynein heavy chain